MNKKDIMKQLSDILENNGITLFDDEEVFFDSVQLITTICDIEETFSIELPEDYLLVENFKDIYAVVNTIHSCLLEKESM